MLQTRTTNTMYSRINLYDGHMTARQVHTAVVQTFCDSRTISFIHLRFRMAHAATIVRLSCGPVSCDVLAICFLIRLFKFLQNVHTSLEVTRKNKTAGMCHEFLCISLFLMFILAKDEHKIFPPKPDIHFHKHFLSCRPIYHTFE